MKKLITGLLAISLLCAGLVGCDQPHSQGDTNHGTTAGTPSSDLPSGITYTSRSVIYTEPGSSFELMTDMEMVEVGSTTYYFASDIPERERLDCMTQTTALLGKLKTAEELSIYVYPEDKFADSAVEGGQVYTHLQDWKSTAYATVILRGIFGGFCNYGLIYGYANYICDRVDTSALTFDPAFGYYDLNDLCFHPDFVTEAELATVQSIANDFVSRYITENGVQKFYELLTASGSVTDCVKANRALAAYYDANGVNVELSTILYGFGGGGYDYSMACAYANFYIMDDWVDDVYGSDTEWYDGFLNRDYPRTKEFFEINIAQMGAYQSYFGLDNYNNDLDIVFINNRLWNHSEYRPLEHCIYLTFIESLMHEYIHSLTSASLPATSWWATEGVASYYETLYNVYALPYWDYIYNTDPVPSVKQYAERQDRPIDASVDMGELCHAFVYCRNHYDPDASYEAATSFVYYLITRFGEDAALDYLLDHHDLSQLGVPSYDQLVEEWKAYVEEAYAGYTKG